jgi:hypothetical protein
MFKNKERGIQIKTVPTISPRIAVTCISAKIPKAIKREPSATHPPYANET